MNIENIEIEKEKNTARGDYLLMLSLYLVQFDFFTKHSG